MIFEVSMASIIWPHMSRSGGEEVHRQADGRRSIYEVYAGWSERQGRFSWWGSHLSGLPLAEYGHFSLE
jgi:hypothetical protein